MPGHFDLHPVLRTVGRAFRQGDEVEVVDHLGGLGPGDCVTGSLSTRPLPRVFTGRQDLDDVVVLHVDHEAKSGSQVADINRIETSSGLGKKATSQRSDCAIPLNPEWYDGSRERFYALRRGLRPRCLLSEHRGRAVTTVVAERSDAVHASFEISDDGAKKTTLRPFCQGRCPTWWRRVGGNRRS